MTEIWKPVVGAEGSYEVSNFGQVRSVTRYVRLVAHGIETRRLSPGKVLRPGPSRSGHLSVAIGKGNSRLVHQLVMEAFVGPRPKWADVAHNDGNPVNNHIDNLRYATRTSNNQDVVYHGRRQITVEQVKIIREVAPTLPYGGKKQLAILLGAHQCTISDVLAGRRHAHV